MEEAVEEVVVVVVVVVVEGTVAEVAVDTTMATEVEGEGTAGKLNRLFPVLVVTTLLSAAGHGNRARD
jgi:hypothetical protein